MSSQDKTSDKAMLVGFVALIALGGAIGWAEKHGYVNLTPNEPLIPMTKVAATKAAVKSEPTPPKPTLAEERQCWLDGQREAEMMTKESYIYDARFRGAAIVDGRCYSSVYYDQGGIRDVYRRRWITDTDRLAAIRRVIESDEGPTKIPQ
jgi:hypothetical protein